MSHFKTQNMTYNKIFNKINTRYLLVCIISIAITSCSKFVELGAPTTQIGVKEAFQSDASATSAVIGLYLTQFNSMALNYSGVVGSSADDIHYSTSSVNYDQFSSNAILPNNSLNGNNLWGSSFSELYQINLVIENLNASTALTPALKNQLLGEALTLRAFINFYLVNLYGDVPLELTTDIATNALIPRTSSIKVWSQIIDDLNSANDLLSPNYPTTQRARINKYTAMALLAKSYLYNKDWTKAENYSDSIISSGIYSLNTNLNQAFTNTSNEIIWQIANTTGVSTFGSNFLAPKGVLPNYILYDTLYNSFEPNDLRKIDWTMTDTIGGKPYYYDYKYKSRSGTGNEYNVVFRLAELYLIRAEARAQQNNTSGAISDLNIIRNRAGLNSLSTQLTKAQVLLAVEQERKVELFGEWGNRWFDLKRTPSVSGNSGLTRADDVLSGIKTGWKPTDIFYPIPSDQILANTKLTQNQGYN